MGAKGIVSEKFLPGFRALFQTDKGVIVTTSDIKEIGKLMKESERNIKDMEKSLEPKRKRANRLEFTNNLETQEIQNENVKIVKQNDSKKEDKEIEER